MQTVNHYFSHIGILDMHLLGFLVQRAVIQLKISFRLLIAFINTLFG